ncbi:hypothetical protein [Bizionia myxarmorum]|uniref:Ribbon-helix-helix protein, CopG family n=1 Tax=Bizionia myxarmorum TaxID=291186 RepID=A0A5D0R9L8_9FLAO|nr:hypothetical protein [Bizionia myxarmorum]TYB78202.1 hypothetical protein ES674_00015 [Bizionia myxarmorum]
MAKKQTIKNNDPSINFRLSNKLKGIIENKAQEKNITTSAYVRDLLERVHNGDYCHAEHVKEEINSFLFSKEFMQLMIWIYSKKINRDKTESAVDLDKYIKTLKRIEGHMPKELVKEFDKVLFDIYRVMDEEYFTYYSFHSSSTEDKKTFNLIEVERFLLSDMNLNLFVNMKGMKDFKFPVVSKIKE